MKISKRKRLCLTLAGTLILLLWKCSNLGEVRRHGESWRRPGESWRRHGELGRPGESWRRHGELGKRPGESWRRHGELGKRPGESWRRHGELGRRPGESWRRHGELGRRPGESWRRSWESWKRPGEPPGRHSNTLKGLTLNQPVETLGFNKTLMGHTGTGHPQMLRQHTESLRGHSLKGHTNALIKRTETRIECTFSRHTNVLVKHTEKERGHMFTEHREKGKRHTGIRNYMNDLLQRQYLTGDTNEKKDTSGDPMRNLHGFADRLGQKNTPGDPMQNLHGFADRLGQKNTPGDPMRDLHGFADRLGQKNTPGDPGQKHNQLIVVHKRPWFVHSTEVDFRTCHHSACTLSYDLSLVSRARALVFDALSLSHTTPPPRLPHQLWVLFFLEAPPVLQLQDPSFQHPEWRNVFNLTMSFRHDSDVFSPYGLVFPKHSSITKSLSAYRQNLSVIFSETEQRNSRRNPHLKLSQRELFTKASEGSTKTLHQHHINDSMFNSEIFSRQESYVNVQHETNKNTLKKSKGIQHKKYKHAGKKSRGSHDFKKKNVSRVRRFLMLNTPASLATDTLPSPEFLRVTAMKTRSAVWLVSHCEADSARDQYVLRLQRHLDVDVYGKCSGRRCGTEAECRFLINTTHKFLLSFENSFCQDYVTEKVFNVYNDLNVIPVVRGGADYSHILPPGTYIDAGDFPSPEALADFLTELSTDHVTYALLLERKHQFKAELWHWQWTLPWCQLCQLVHEDSTMSPGSRVYLDMADWITNNTCWNPYDLA